MSLPRTLTLHVSGVGEAVNKCYRKRRRLGLGPGGRQAFCPQASFPAVLLCPLDQGLGNHFLPLRAASAPSVPGGASPGAERPFSLNPQSKCSGPFPGKVLLTGAARNGRGITMVGTDPRTPPKLLG